MRLLASDLRAGSEVTNNDVAVVEEVDQQRRALRVRLVNGAYSGQQRWLSEDFVARGGRPVDGQRRGGLDHAYAATVHRAQGATADSCHVLLGDTAFREQAYTALSRGRTSNRLYLTRDVADAALAHADVHHRPVPSPRPDGEALLGLRPAVGRSRAQEAATPSSQLDLGV